MKLEVVPHPTFKDNATLYMGTTILAGFFCVVMVVISGLGLVPMSFTAWVIIPCTIYAPAVAIKYMFEKRAYEKRLQHYRDLQNHRHVTWDDIKWLDEHQPDCTLYSLKTYSTVTRDEHILTSKDYVVFNNKTDEMLFTIAMGQRRGV